MCQRHIFFLTFCLLPQYLIFVIVIVIVIVNTQYIVIGFQQWDCFGCVKRHLLKWAKHVHNMGSGLGSIRRVTVCGHVMVCGRAGWSCWPILDVCFRMECALQANTYIYIYGLLHRKMSFF